ncbi:MAG: hypothetical protein ACLQU1_05315 [Bryobacteraceae bacterium]
MMLPPESALLLRAAAALVPSDRREEWRREWHAELWWWLSSTPDPSRLVLAHHCAGAVVDAFWLRAGAGFSVRDWLALPINRLAVPALLLVLLAAASGGFRHTRVALFATAPDRLVILTEIGPFMGKVMALPPARAAEWSARSRSLETVALVSRTMALGRLKRGATAAQAEAELRALRKGSDFLHVTPYAATIYRPIAFLGPAFLALVLLTLLHWLLNWLRSAISPAFSLAHPLAWLALLFLAAVEYPAGPAALFLPYLIASFLALRFCWHDQRQRCPVCLDRLALPVRIGVGPRSPFEPAGTEFLCPHGHGALFTTQEAEPESRWTPLVA